MSNEAKVGLTVFLAIVVATIGFRFMRDVPILRQSLEITSTFERIDGISAGSIVYISGVKVGSVSRVRLLPNHNVQVAMSIDTQTPIPRGSVAYLTSLGIVEGKSIIIEISDSNEMVEHGEEIEGYYVDSMMEVLSNKGEELGEDISASIFELNSFLRQLNETLDDDTRNTLDQTLNSASDATNRIASILEGKQQEIDLAIDSGTRLLSRLDTMAADNQPRVDSLMTALEHNVAELERVRTGLETATESLNEILDKINHGEGTLGRLVNDPSVYDNLDSLTIEMNKFFKGINEEPGRYLKHMNIIELF
ncbi:MAG: MlaD family protein [Balneolaceae bacterium]